MKLLIINNEVKIEHSRILSHEGKSLIYKKTIVDSPRWPIFYERTDLNRFLIRNNL